MRPDRENLQLTVMCSIDEYNFEQIDNFKYLGFDVGKHGRIKEEIKERIVMATMLLCTATYTSFVLDNQKI